MKWLYERILFYIGLALVIWFLIAFVVFPLGSALYAALFKDGTFVAVQTALELIASKRVRAAIFNTVWMTVASTVTVTILGIFQVAVLEYFHVRGRTILKIGFAVPLVFGSVIAATGYNFTYGPSGVLTVLLQKMGIGIDQYWFQGWFGVLYAHTFLLTNFYFLFLRAAMRRIDYSTIEAARNLGASEWTIIRRVVLPSTLPVLLAVLLLTIYTAVGSFAAPQILGGRDFHMLSQMILTLNSLRRQDMAALLALFMGVFIAGLIVLSRYLEKRGHALSGGKTPVPIQLRTVANPVLNVLLHVVSYVLVVLYVVPVILVILFSFAPGSSIGAEVIPSVLTLKNYIQVFTMGSAFAPFFNSMIMVISAVVVGVALTIFSVQIFLRYRNVLTAFLEWLFVLPWFVPSILLAVGLIAAFDAPNILVGGLTLLGSYWLLPIGYVIIVLPLMVRFLRAAFMNIDPVYDDAARSFNAPAFYRFRRITFPLIAPVVLLVSGMAFNRLITEYSVSAFLFNVNNLPLPVAIVEGGMNMDPEQKAITLVYATIVMAFSFIIMLSAERVGLGKRPDINKL